MQSHIHWFPQLCVLIHTRFHIKLSSSALYSPPKLTSWNLKSIWNMPSILTCAIITLHKHQPVSTVWARTAIKQQRWNFGVKTSPFSISSPCENQPCLWWIMICKVRCQLASCFWLVDFYFFIVNQSQQVISGHVFSTYYSTPNWFNRSHDMTPS